MTDLDDDSVARALLLEHTIDTDLRDPAKSILLAQLAVARAAAIEAMRILLTVDPTEAKAIMTAQNEVERFRFLHAWLLNTQRLSRDAFAQLPIEEQSEILAYLNPKREINDA